MNAHYTATAKALHWVIAVLIFGNGVFVAAEFSLTALDRSTVEANARKGGRRDVPYRAPTPDEERAYSSWIEAVSRAALTGAPPSVAPPPGFAP